MSLKALSSAHTYETGAVTLSPERKLKILGHWFGSLLPAMVVVGSGLLVFQEAVTTSVASTPHPELVYAILGTFLVGVFLTCLTLYRYTMEGNLMHRWSRVSNEQREALLSSLSWKTYLQPVFEIMLGKRRLDAGNRQSVLEQEITAVNDRFNDRLALPNYLAGALVGLGLVGTFVGLLGTLEDLGKLFGALVQTGSASSNPAEIFSDMVRRLQDPMRGMGTAFVASLYGLLGSLILGLQILAVGKIGHGLIHQLHVVVRREDITDAYEFIHSKEVADTRDVAIWNIKQIQAWNELHKTLRSHYEHQEIETNVLRQEVLGMFQNSQTLTEKILNQVATTSKKTVDEQNKRWEDMGVLIRTHLEQNQNETQLLRHEILKVTQTCQSMANALRDGLSAEERFRQEVPRTSYWQEAWMNVQTYLQRSKTDQGLQELSHIVKLQSQILKEIATQLKELRESYSRSS